MAYDVVGLLSLRLGKELDKFGYRDSEALGNAKKILHGRVFGSPDNSSERGLRDAAFSGCLSLIGDVE